MLSTPSGFPHAPKSLLKEARSLNQSKFRRETGLFFAEGVKLVEELLESNISVVSVFGLPSALNTLHAQFPDAAYFEISSSELEYISDLKSPNKVLAVAKIPSVKRPHYSSEAGNLIALDRIADPGNMGTIIRTAEWFGVSHILCSPDSVDCWSPKVVQSAMGSLFRSPIFYGDLKTEILQAVESGTHHIAGASLDGRPVDEKINRPILLVIGSESHGISEELLNVIPEKVLIPKSPSVPTESLNASVATGILLYAMTGK